MMKSAEKIKLNMSRYNRHIRHLYFTVVICLSIVLAKATFSFQAKPEKAVAQTSTFNPNVLKADEIKKLSALLTSNKKPADKILPSPAPIQTSAVEPSNSRCNYNHQDYLPGDIVKTDQGWVRCTPTLIFNPEPAENKLGSPAWIAVQ